MAKKWYPVIDIQTCEECGACVKKCTHGVYSKEKAPVPIVVNPEGCIDHCHGCGNICPTGSISYVGDDTGWKAPALMDSPAKTEECCCCGGNEPGDAEKQLRIEYLYLDLVTCDRCIGTDAVLDEVVKGLRPALELAGYAVTYEKHEIKNARMAKEYGFLSSPTILVNGQDIFGPVQESNCGCCGDIAGVEVDCRVFTYNGKSYEVPTKEMLADTILKSLYAAPACCCSGEYTLPENLRRFFEGKEKKAGGTSSCCCGCSCGD